MLLIMLSRTLLSDMNADANIVHAKVIGRSMDTSIEEGGRDHQPALPNELLPLLMGRPNSGAVANRLLKYCVCMLMA